MWAAARQSGLWEGHLRVPHSPASAPRSSQQEQRAGGPVRTSYVSPKGLPPMNCRVKGFRERSPPLLHFIKHLLKKELGSRAIRRGAPPKNCPCTGPTRRPSGHPDPINALVTGHGTAWSQQAADALRNRSPGNVLGDASTKAGSLGHHVKDGRCPLPGSCK